MTSEQAEIFLSYCWKDEGTANNIAAVLGKVPQIHLHRDVLDIGTWGSIKEYMQSIPRMDYTILLISDAYLNSTNCMYEVLEVMRSRQYREKIFPAVVYTGIYKPEIRAGYVKYWQNECDKLKQALEGINPQNLGPLTEDLKRKQDIAANMAEFLGVVADMNNPAIDDVCMAIENKLKEKGILSEEPKTVSNQRPTTNLFSAMGITPKFGNEKPTDYELNQFVSRSFKELNDLMIELCKELEEQYRDFQVVPEMVDSRHYAYQFYRKGKSVKSLMLFLDNSMGAMSIGLSNDISFMSGGQSFNAIYSVENVDGNLRFKSLFGFMGNRNAMTVEDVVKDIWESHINPYLR